MTAPAPLPGPLAKAPLIADWIAFPAPGRAEFRTGRVELGQGNLTALLQIAAEELDLDPAACRIVGGATDLTPDEGFTSGSLSIAQGGMALRLAASAARHCLLATAARLLQCPAGALSVAAGRVLHEGAETPLTLWALAAETALDRPVADWAAPKPAQARHLAGGRLDRIDLEARITGTPFVHDMAPEGLLHGRVLQPPRIGMRLGPVDMEALRARPGVVAALRDGDVLALAARSNHAAERAIAWAEARAEWSASDLAAPPADPAADPIAALEASDAPAEIVHRVGVDGAGRDGREFRLTLARPFLSHGSIGPSAALALWQQDDRLQVWTHSQGVFPLRAALAQVFGIAEDRITLRHMPGAGCYGHNGADDAALDAALIARAVPGRPVRMQWRRGDEFRLAPLGPAMQTHARAWVSPDGWITAMEVTATSAPHGNRPGRGGAPNLRAAACLARPFPMPRSGDVPLARGGGADRNAVPGYAIPNLTIAKRVVQDLPWRTSSLRSLGAHVNVLALESLIDDIAAARGEHPAALRLRHLAHDPRARAVIEAVVRDAGDPFATPRPEGTGWGLGYARYKNTAAWCAILARLNLTDEIRVTEVFAALDAGEIINPDGAINQTEGGILQAISWTLKEQVRLERDRVATGTWHDYPILRFDEVPQVRVRLITHTEAPPLGCAEAAQGPTAAAIGNALRDATGLRLTRLPFDRDAILAALG